jgi:hypothetical protein
MKYELYRISAPKGEHYAFVADDEHKLVQLEINADGDPYELVWVCEASSSEEAIRKMNEFLDDAE